MHPFESALIAELRAADMERIAVRGPRHDVPIAVPGWRRLVGQLLVRAGQRIERPRPLAAPPRPTTELAARRCA